MDQKPSSILLYIKELSGDSKEAFERQVLLNCLPEAVRTALSTSTAPNNEEFAKEANRVMESYCLAHKITTSTVASISAESEDPPQEVAAVSRSTSNYPPPLCMPHAHYRVRAFSCRSAKCPMRGQIQQRGPASNQRRSFPGNGGAGRQ